MKVIIYYQSLDGGGYEIKRFEKIKSVSVDPGSNSRVVVMLDTNQDKQEYRMRDCEHLLIQ